MERDNQKYNEPAKECLQFRQNVAADKLILTVLITAALYFQRQLGLTCCRPCEVVI